MGVDMLVTPFPMLDLLSFSPFHLFRLQRVPEIGKVN